MTSSEAGYILVVDDEDLVRSLLTTSLGEAGYDVQAASNGEEALRAVHAEPPRMVITDILMPGRDGLELIKAMRDEGVSCPILAISGGGRLPEAYYLKLAQALGADVVMEKPFPRPKLLDTVRHLLES